MALAQMQLAAEQSRHERDMTYRQQQAEIEKAMQEQRLSLEKQEFDARMQVSQQQLQLQQQEFKMKSDQAAQKAAAQMGFQKEMQAEIAAGGDGTKSFLKWGPLLGGQGTPEAAILRSMLQKKAQAPETVKGQPVIGEDGKPIPGVFATMNAQGFPTIHNIPGAGQRPGSMSQEDHEAMTEARNVIKDFQKKWNDPLASRLKLTPQGKKDFESDQAQAADAAQTLREYAPNSPLASMFLSPPGGAAAAAPGGAVRWTKDASGKPIPEAGPSPAGGALTAPAAAPNAPGPGAPTGPSFWPMGGGGEEGPAPQSGGTPLANMALAGAKGPIPAPQTAAPKGPEVPDYIRSYREELEKPGPLSNGAKDYLSDMIAGFSDEALVKAANKHGVDDVWFKDGQFGRKQTPTEMKKASDLLGGPVPDQGASIGRMDIEDDLYNSALALGWQLPWPE